MQFEKVKIRLNQVDHTYEYLLNENWCKPSKTISGSMFFKPYFDDKFLTSKIKLYGRVAMDMGTNIHLLCEHILTHYNIHRDIKIISEIKDKYMYDNRMLYNTLYQLEIIITELNPIKIENEVAIGFYDKPTDTLICGTTDSIFTLNDGSRVGIDYKTKATSKKDFLEFRLEFIFDGILDKIISGHNYGYYIEKNNLPYSQLKANTEKCLNYIYQFGLYSLLHNLDFFYMLPSDSLNYIFINKQKLEKLKDVCFSRINLLIEN